MGKTYTDSSKQQWTGPELVQLREEPAPAAPATPEAAPQPAAAEEKPVASTTVGRGPQYSYDAKKKSIENTSSAVKQQQADESDFVKNHKSASAKIAEETETTKNAFKKDRSQQIIGDVDLPKTPEPWYKQKYMTPS